MAKVREETAEVEEELAREADAEEACRTRWAISSSRSSTWRVS